MNHIHIPINGNKCYDCKKNIYAVESFANVDYLTCPICSSACQCCSNNTLDIGDKKHYCYTCNILFGAGCVHSRNSTDTTYYGELIYKYVYNNIEFNGMPKFKSISQYLKILPKLTLIWKCMCYKNNGLACSHNNYLYDKYPNNYRYICKRKFCTLCTHAYYNFDLSAIYKNHETCRKQLRRLLNKYICKDVCDIIMKYDHYIKF